MLLTLGFVWFVRRHLRLVKSLIVGAVGLLCLALVYPRVAALIRTSSGDYSKAALHVVPATESAPSMSRSPSTAGGSSTLSRQERR
eukprot:36455-Prorocentrum_minimum.AAC.1